MIVRQGRSKKQMDTLGIEPNTSRIHPPMLSTFNSLDLLFVLPSRNRTASPDVPNQTHRQYLSQARGPGEPDLASSIGRARLRSAFQTTRMESGTHKAPSKRKIEVLQEGES
jgi:hypothetical protein